MVELTTMRRQHTHPSANRLAKQLVFEVLHLVPEVLQLLCQCHFGLGKQLTLFVLDMLFHREAQGVEFRFKGLRIGLKPPELFDAHIDLFMVLEAGVHECVSGAVGFLSKGWVEHLFFHLRMQRQRDKECHGNPLLHVGLVGCLIALKQLVDPPVVGFEHLDRIGRLDKALMLKEIIVLHGSGILLGPLSVQRPCSHSERTSRCPCEYTSCGARAVPRQGSQSIVARACNTWRH